jgi:DNA-binding MarR family transcriptional regulator
VTQLFPFVRHRIIQHWIVHSRTINLSTFGDRINKVDVPDRATAVVAALLHADRIISDSIEKGLRAQAGLSLAQYEVLLRLSEAPQRRLRMVDIAERLCVSKSGVTQLVDRLEEAGMVERQFQRSDRRLTYAKITGRGTEALRRSIPEIERAVQEHLARHLTEDEMHRLHEALVKVHEGNRDLGDRAPAATRA